MKAYLLKAQTLYDWIDYLLPQSTPEFKFIINVQCSIIQWVDIVHYVAYQGPGLRMVLLIELVFYTPAVAKLLCEHA